MCAEYRLGPYISQIVLILPKMGRFHGIMGPVLANFANINRTLNIVDLQYDLDHLTYSAGHPEPLIKLMSNTQALFASRMVL